MFTKITKILAAATIAAAGATTISAIHDKKAAKDAEECTCDECPCTEAEANEAEAEEE